MQNPNVPLSQQATVAAVIAPAEQAAGGATRTSDWVSMADYEILQAIVQAGAMGAGATLNAKLEQAQDDSGTGAKDIAGKAITEIPAAGANSVAIVNAQATDLDQNNGFTHVRLSMTNATQTVSCAGVLQGGAARHQPPGPHSSVAEVVT